MNDDEKNANLIGIPEILILKERRSITSPDLRTHSLFTSKVIRDKIYENFPPKKKFSAKLNVGAFDNGKCS